MVDYVDWTLLRYLGDFEKTNVHGNARFLNS